MNMAEDSGPDTSNEDVSYHSSPMETEETCENLSPAVLLKKLDPQFKNRLYSKICSTKDISNLVGTLLSQFVTNKEKIINMLVQLFIDMSAYQYINVENFVKYNDLMDIVSHMNSSRNSILYKTGKYILKMGKYANKCRKIGDFLETFIMLSSKEKILYNPSICVIFQIVEKMSESNIRPIKHTGVFIGLKLQTGLLRISYMIGQKIETYHQALEVEKDPKERRIFEHKVEKFYTYSTSVNKLIEFVYLRIFKKNWNHADSQLHFMRNDCLLEIKTWIKIFPDRFLNNDYIVMVINLSEDTHAMVRQTAVNLLNEIIIEYHLKINDTNLNKIIAILGKRIFDVNYDVGIKAIETLTLIHKFTRLPHTIRDDLCKQIYFPHYPLAAAAGKFLIDRINHHIADPNDPQEFLKMLVYFEKKSIEKKIIDKYPYVVEAIIDFVPVLIDVPVYLSILENCKRDEDSIAILIKLLTESVYETFLGTSTLVRPKQIKRKANPETIQKLSKQLIDSVGKLQSLVPLDNLRVLLYLIKNYAMKEVHAGLNSSST